MFTGGHGGFTPQIELPNPGWAPPPDFSQMNAPTASEIFPEPPPTAPNLRPHIPGLMAAPPSTERDTLIAQYLDICEKVEQFIVRSKSERAAKVQTEFDAQWLECRRLESELGRVTSEIAHWQGLANTKALSVSQINERLSEVQRPNTNFPTAQEIAAYDGARSAIKNELAAHHAEIKQAQIFIGGLESTLAELRKKLNGGTEALAALRQRMNALKD